MAILLSAAMLVPNTGAVPAYAATDEVVDEVTLETELDSTEEEKENLEDNAELESSEDEAENPEEELESSEGEAENSELVQDLSDLESQLYKLQRESENLSVDNTKILELQRENDNLRSELDSITGERDEAKDIVCRQLNERRKLEDEITELKEKRGGLQIEVSLLLKRIASSELS